MFQSFTETGNPDHVAARLALFRKEMARQGLDGFIVPRADEHQGEYVAPGSERLRWLTGFSGSAGNAVILAEKAVLLVDGRYTLQAKRQTDTALISVEDGVAVSVSDWLDQTAAKGARIGFDPWLTTARTAEALRASAEKAGWIAVPVETNLVDRVWADRPPAARKPIRLHPPHYAGQSSDEKIAQLAKALTEAGADATILSDPAAIAWMLNIRGADITHLPVALGFAILEASGAVELFLTAASVPAAVKTALGKTIRFSPRSSLLTACARLAKTGRAVLIDPAQTPVAIRDALDGARIIAKPDIVLRPRAIKNATELQGSRNAHARDGAAMATFLAWLDRQAPGTVSEIDAAKKLEEFRRKTGKRLGVPLKDISFDTISGSGPHGAIVHYRVTTGTDRMLGANELYLVDSGGQYEDATTDITRTVVIGEPDAAMVDAFTRVLRGMLAISRARFPNGTRGMDIDAMARAPLWEAGLDYGHGTGHGVGSYLGVHEGPQNISKRGMAPLEPGMIISNEPGYYREGAFGIRIENLVAVTPAETPDGGDRPMMGFETLTLCPIDTRLVDPAQMTAQEIAWLDAYHERVQEVLTPLVPSNVRAWLKRATRPLSRRRR